MTHIVNIIYQDDHLLVLDKPPGLVVDPAESVKTETLVDILKKDFNSLLPRGGIVHRLDKDTSGILLVAKTLGALGNLQNQFKERLVQKEYLVLVHGYVEESGTVSAAIMRNPANREKFVVASQVFDSEGGTLRTQTRRGDALEAREAITEYESVERLQFSGDRLQEIFVGFNKIQMRKLFTIHYNLFTLLRCKPKTGRTHQIRVHLKYIGHPIVADEKYGGRKINRLDRRWCPRMFLHAAKIGFKHPISGKWLELESPLPEDLKKALTCLSSRT